MKWNEREELIHEAIERRVRWLIDKVTTEERTKAHRSKER